VAIALVLLGGVFVVVACEDLSPTSGEETTAASMEATGGTGATGGGEATDGSTTTGGSGVTDSSDAPSTTAAPPTTAPPVETPTTVVVTFPDITEEQVIALVEDLEIYPAGAVVDVFDYRTFGDLAGAYVWAEDDDVYLVVFSWQSGGWRIMDFMNGPWEDMRVRLVNSFNPPQEFLDWANPEGD
jgi:hypothetical protein